ncbi:MAG TPA: hypothetical protein VGH38_36260 [Bryobacteraceae bacterium]
MCLLLLLLSVIVVAQTSSLEPHHSPDHCCLLCHVGPMPLVKGATTATAAPILSVVWLAAHPNFQPTHEVLLSASSSRAPPA